MLLIFLSDSTLVTVLAVFIFQYFQITVANYQNRVGSQHESKLIHYLLEHKQYNPLIRPVSNLSDTISVQLELAMIQIIAVEEKSQIMKSNVWLRLKWTDYQLRWEPSDFGNVDTARINPSRVWQPDIVLFNNADGNYEVSWQPNVLVSPDGSVLWIPPAIFISSCTIHVEYFPFDDQSCEMKFGSWTFDASQLTLGYIDGKSHVDLTDYWKSGSWTIVDCPSRMENNTGADQSRETQIIYTIVLQRKSLFYTINLIIPCVLISLLSVCVFYLPADAGEKMTLSISILLSLVVFLLLISRILPPTSSSIPLISKYLLFTFIMNVFTITITVVIINWNFRSPNTHKMSLWIRKWFIDVLPKFLMMERPERKYSVSSRKVKDKTIKISKSNNNNHDIDYIAYNPSAFIYSPSFLRKSYQSLSQEIINSDNTNNSDNILFTNPWNTYQHSSHQMFDSTSDKITVDKKDKCTCSASTNNIQQNYVNKIHCDTFECQSSPSDISVNDISYDQRKDPRRPNSPKQLRVSNRMRTAISAINFISEHLDMEENNKKIMQDWKYVAAVFDRIQLVIFSIVTIVGTMGILLKAIHIWKNVDEHDTIRRFSASSL